MGFVIAALVAVVFLTDWPLDAAEVRRRFYQVALAFTLVSFVLALGVLGFPSRDSASAIQGGFGNDQGAQFYHALRERSILTAACALALVVVSLTVGRPWATVSTSALLGGIILLLSSVIQDSNSLATAIYDVSSEAGIERNLIIMLVQAVGSAGLILFGYREWDDPALVEEA